MSDLFSLFFLLLFLTIIAAPVVIPVVVAFKSKTVAASVKVALVLAAVLTAFYVVLKYGEALDHDSDFKGFRVFAIPPVEYVFAVYTIAVLVSAAALIHRMRSGSLRQPGSVPALLTLAACVALGVLLGQPFMQLPFGDDTLSKKRSSAEPNGPTNGSPPFRLLVSTNFVEAGSGR